MNVHVTTCTCTVLAIRQQRAQSILHAHVRVSTYKSSVTYMYVHINTDSVSNLERNTVSYSK